MVRTITQATLLNIFMEYYSDHHRPRTLSTDYTV